MFADMDDDENADMMSVGPDVDEDKLIAEKYEFEKKSILKHRSLFSETLSPNRYIRAPQMTISIKNSPDKASDLSLYYFKPRVIPLNIKSQARGIVRRYGSSRIYSYII